MGSQAFTGSGTRRRAGGPGRPEPRISESCLGRWMEQYAVDADRKEGLISAERRELVELRRKNRVNILPKP
jgi:hypothetical protein